MATVPEAILDVFDALAYGRQVSQAAFASIDLYSKTQAANDEPFLNAVQDYELSALDAWLKGGSYENSSGTTVSFTGGADFNTTVPINWFATLETYARTIAGYAATSSAPAIAALLAALSGARVPFAAAECVHEAFRKEKRIPAAQVFPKGTLPANGATPANAGLHSFGVLTGPTTWVAGSGDIPATVGTAGILAINKSAAQTVGGTFRCYLDTTLATYKDIALDLSAVAQYTQTILGKQAIASGAAAGQKVISVAATAQFAEGQTVLIYESDALQEVGVIAVGGIVANTSITLVNNLINSYTNAGFVIPCFRSAKYQSGGSGTGDVEIYALPDRTIAL